MPIIDVVAAAGTASIAIPTKLKDRIAADGCCREFRFGMCVDREAPRREKWVVPQRDLGKWVLDSCMDNRSENGRQEGIDKARFRRFLVRPANPHLALGFRRTGQ